MIMCKGGPWQEHIFLRGMDKLLYVIFPSDRGGYMLQCVPDKLDSFGVRKSLPVAWKGLRANELAAVLGPEFVSDQSLFCHDALFIGGALTLENVISMAEKAVEYVPVV